MGSFLSHMGQKTALSSRSGGGRRENGETLMDNRAGIVEAALPMKVTYYLEVISSWCYWAEPAWAELKQRFSGKVEFGWKLALMDASGLPVSRGQCEWFYRRSGTIMRSPFMLNSGWFEPELKEYLAPNLVAEAARDFGVNDDRARLAIAAAGLREGRKVGRWEEAEARARSTTAEFHALQVTQRPTFLIENSIGDRAVFSGLVLAAPLVAAIDAMLNDAAAYASHAAHFGSAPAN